MDTKSPIPGVILLPNGRTLWLVNGGAILATYESWDDPPSTPSPSHKWYISGIYCQLGDYMLPIPPFFSGNQKQPLIMFPGLHSKKTRISTFWVDHFPNFSGIPWDMFSRSMEGIRFLQEMGRFFIEKSSVFNQKTVDFLKYCSYVRTYLYIQKNYI